MTISSVIRVRCVSTRAYPGALNDPVLVKGDFYTVIDPEVHTIADNTPYISVLVKGSAIERPRHLFGRLLNTTHH